MVRVVVQIPDQDVPLIAVGDPVDILIDALPGAKFLGKISRFAEVEDGQTRLMRAEVDLPNADNKLHPGMYGKVIVHLSSSHGVIRVPASALHEQTDDGQATLYVVQNGKAELRHVRRGKDNGHQVEILDGLTGGDEVVVSQSGQLFDGAPVEVIHPTEGGAAEQVAENHET